MHLFKIGCLVAASLGAASSVSAAVLDFALTDAGGDTASGQFTVSNPALPTVVTAITGVFDGLAITGLSPYASADQMLLPPSPSSFTFGGLSFSVGAIDYNLTSYPNGLGSVINSLTDPGGFGVAPVAITSFTVAVPEPATWALMVVGIGGLGVAMRSRRRAALA